MSEFIKTININQNKYSIRLMDNANAKEINLFFKLFQECFGVRSHLDKTWFKWYYNQNPIGVCNNYLMFDLDTSMLIGAYGFAKIAYSLSSQNKVGVLGVNGMINKDYTKQGLYAELMNVGLENETKNNLAFSFPHGNNIGSVKGHYNSNWKLFEDLFFYEKLTPKRNTSIPANNIKQIYESDLEKISLKSSKDFCFTKNAEFIKWRYLDRPHRNYIIIGNYISDNKIDGYIIMGKYVEKNKNIRCQIVDFKTEDIDTFDSLLKSVEYYADTLEASKIDLIISNKSKYLNTLKNNNYKDSGELYKLMIYPKIEDNTISNALLGDFDAV